MNKLYTIALACMALSVTNAHDHEQDEAAASAVMSNLTKNDVAGGSRRLFG